MSCCETSQLADEKREPCEYMRIEDTYSPLIHRIGREIRKRAIKPEAEVAPPAEVLMKWCHPPPDLVETSKKSIDALVAAADVKKGL